MIGGICILLAYRVIADITGYCWRCRLLLTSRVITTDYCWHHGLLAPRIVADIVGYCWYCGLISRVIAGITGR